jgi:hypothetical protein
MNYHITEAWNRKLGYKGYIKLYQLAQCDLTVQEAGVGLALSLKGRQLGKWDGCHTAYLSTSDIQRAIGHWERANFRAMVKAQHQVQVGDNNGALGQFTRYAVKTPLILTNYLACSMSRLTSYSDIYTGLWHTSTPVRFLPLPTQLGPEGVPASRFW